MSQSDLESLGKMASSNTSPPPELDTVFSNFFQKLEELPPVPKPRSAKDYLESNRDKIIHALSKGYSYSDLAQMLRDCGFSISASTLRRYIGAFQGTKGDALHSDNSSTPAFDSPDNLDESREAATKKEPYQSQLRPRRRKS